MTASQRRKTESNSPGKRSSPRAIGRSTNGIWSSRNVRLPLSRPKRRLMNEPDGVASHRAEGEERDHRDGGEDRDGELRDEREVRGREEDRATPRAARPGSASSRPEEEPGPRLRGPEHAPTVPFRSSGRSPWRRPVHGGAWRARWRCTSEAAPRGRRGPRRGTGRARATAPLRLPKNRSSAAMTPSELLRIDALLGLVDVGRIVHAAEDDRGKRCPRRGREPSERTRIRAAVLSADPVGPDALSRRIRSSFIAAG